MATPATEGYVDVRAQEVRASTLLELERIMGRWMRWIIMAVFAAAALTVSALSLIMSLFLL